MNYPAHPRPIKNETQFANKKLDELLEGIQSFGQPFS